MKHKIYTLNFFYEKLYTRSLFLNYILSLILRLHNYILINYFLNETSLANLSNPSGKFLQISFALERLDKPD